VTPEKLLLDGVEGSPHPVFVHHGLATITVDVAVAEVCLQADDAIVLPQIKPS
jgi:hypothetical protein